ncbi:MAG: MFS transporter [Cyanobacteria bacterium P01_A01_bin.17]
MSVVCAAIKNGEVVIACDTQISFGSTIVTSTHIANSNKLHRVNDSIIGIVGWNTLSDMVDHLILKHPDRFQLSNRMEIYSTLLELHSIMKKDYFLNTKTSDNKQPVESSQFNAIIVNPHGLFEISKLREVNEYRQYWSVGSGRQYALGAMHAAYAQDASASQIVTAGIAAGCEFDQGCSLPICIEVLYMHDH